MRNVILKNITDKADALAVANEYNKTKDPGIRDQWYKLLKTVPGFRAFGRNSSTFSQENFG
jgi:hypothetical protein